MTRQLLLAALLAASPLSAQTLKGLWDATVQANGVEIPFRMELSTSGTTAKGSFFNGDAKVTSTSGKFEHGALALTFDYYAATLEATWKDGALDGKYIR